MRQGWLLLLWWCLSPAWASTDWNVLLATCASSVHPDTMGAIVRHESGGSLLAIGDSGEAGLPKSRRVLKSYYPKTVPEGVSIARRLIAQGHLVDIGPGQVNHRNIKRLGYSLEDAFDPCKNLNMAATILTGNYLDAMNRFGPGDRALLAAISAYNTGNFVDGFKNGYVSKVVSKMQQPLVPQMHARAVAGTGNGKWYDGVVKTRTRPGVQSVRASAGEVPGWFVH